MRITVTRLCVLISMILIVVLGAFAFTVIDETSPAPRRSELTAVKLEITVVISQPGSLVIMLPNNESIETTAEPKTACKLWLVNEGSSPFAISVLSHRDSAPSRNMVLLPGTSGFLEIGQPDVVLIRTNPATDPENAPMLEV